MWENVARKYMVVVAKVVAAPFSPNFALIAYNTFAVPVCSHIAQVAKPLAKILSYERHDIGRVLRLLGNSLTVALAANLDQIGLVKAVAIQLCGVAAFRESKKTIKSWPFALSRLNRHFSMLSASERVFAVSGQLFGTQHLSLNFSKRLSPLKLKVPNEVLLSTALYFLQEFS